MPNIYKRQSGIIDIKAYRDNKITIVGCGAIGSFLAISLAKMGLTWFELWDYDKVEEHNLPNQYYSVDDIEKRKVIALNSHMISFNPKCKNIFRLMKFDKNSNIINSKIVISAVDNMETRKLIFDKCKKDKDVQLFIDARMHKFQGQVYFIDMSKKKEIKNYEKSLFEDSDAVVGRCTERSIIFTVLGISSLICNEIVKAFKGDKIKNYIVIDYSVPQII